MGFFKNIINKLNSGFFYIVDLDTLKQHLERQVQFSLTYNLEMVEELNIYLSGVKHNITIWNYSASNFKDEQLKGMIFYYDKQEFKSLDALFESCLRNVDSYFKIEIVNSDNAILNEYKKAHPELKIEDF